MDYTGAERLKQTLEKLEKFVQSGGNVTGKDVVDTKQLELLQSENDALKSKQTKLLQELDDVILSVEIAMEENEKNKEGDAA